MNKLNSHRDLETVTILFEIIIHVVFLSDKYLSTLVTLCFQFTLIIYCAQCVSSVDYTRSAVVLLNAIQSFSANRVAFANIESKWCVTDQCVLD